MFEKYLQEIGLNEKEASLYLALLQVDNASVIDLSKKTKINRSTVYVVLEGLMKKGLVSETQIGKKVHYQSEPPERLETFVERQKVVFEERAQRLKDVIPQLKSVERHEGERPIIKFFEGREGAVSAYEEFYSFNKSVEEEGYFVYSRDLIDSTFTESEKKKFLDLRLGKKVKPNVVYTRKAGEMTFDTPGIRTRIDHENFPISVDIVTIGDRVVIVTLGSTITSILIKSKDLANTLASLVRYINQK